MSVYPEKRPKKKKKNLYFVVKMIRQTLGKVTTTQGLKDIPGSDWENLVSQLGWAWPQIALGAHRSGYFPLFPDREDQFFSCV